MMLTEFWRNLANSNGVEQAVLVQELLLVAC
jgi:hypothetical protein